MEVKKAGVSLDSVISGFNRRIAELQNLVIARNMYPVSDAALKAMELQVQAIKGRLRDETLAINFWKLIDEAMNQHKKLQDMSVSNIPERMSKLGLDTNEWKESASFGSFKLQEEPAAMPKEVGNDVEKMIMEKKGRSAPPLWFITTDELDSLSG